MANETRHLTVGRIHVWQWELCKFEVPVVPVVNAFPGKFALPVFAGTAQIGPLFFPDGLSWMSADHTSK